MTLEKLSAQILPAVESRLQEAVSGLQEPQTQELWQMLAYHLGWEDTGQGKPAGKRVRPLLVALSCQAAGGDWQHALPAAAAVEFVHNFSLIHDDIEDNSPMRRGRATVWMKWGMAQAINAGDTLFTLAFSTILGLGESLSSEVAMRAADMLQSACLRLTQGQFLDLYYENQDHLEEAQYWQMIAGKTAALLRASTGLGALCAGASPDVVGDYQRFGELLGLAFQVQDDYLGIWGDARVTGKSAESDLLAGKKTLPVVYALNKGGDFARRWVYGSISPEELEEVIGLLENEGAREYTQQKAAELTQQAGEALENLHSHGEAGEALEELSQKLLTREA